MRIVSLCPSLTELVFDLGRGDELVGITEYCVHPRERVGAIEKVGGTKTPRVERIVELEPDLVLFNEEENRREDETALRAAGVRCLTTFPRDCQGAADMVRTIGVALERPAEAERIATDIEARAARVRREAEAGPPVRFAYLIWRKPWMSVNRDTFVHGLLAQAGGDNVFGERAERYPEITAADLTRLAPDVVLLGTEPFPFQDKHIPELAELTGLGRERFQVADGEYLSWHGSRTPAGIDYAAGLLRAVRRRL
ncbi:MAG TPA: helical backbone metal receptor [Polyangia bacterium]|jgi:ABC-type Fe3+-hydroxamate transport system substrate-binding protein|nr:helical backbone metal receptor [Polyangia bacterium]